MIVVLLLKSTYFIFVDNVQPLAIRRNLGILIVTTLLTLHLLPHNSIQLTT